MCRSWSLPIEDTSLTRHRPQAAYILQTVILAESPLTLKKERDTAQLVQTSTQCPEMYVALSHRRMYPSADENAASRSLRDIPIA